MINAGGSSCMNEIFNQHYDSWLLRLTSAHFNPLDTADTLYVTETHRNAVNIKLIKVEEMKRYK